MAQQSPAEQKTETSAAKPSAEDQKTGLKRRIGFGKRAPKALSKDVKVRAPRWLRAIGRYFAGAWFELRQVRWPNRRATWSLTGAVIVFTAVMVAFVLALDFGFEQLFKRILL